MIKLVIFDMAGTSVSEDNVVYKTVKAAIERAGYSVSLDTVLEFGAGKEKRQAISDVLDSIHVSLSDDEIDAIHSDFKHNLDAAYDTADLKLFDSVQALLPILRSLDICVAFNTGYKRAMARRILDQIDIVMGRDIDMLVAADDVSRGRPNPDMILKICDELEISPSKAIKVGDSVIDIEEGKNAQVALTIGVTTGAQSRELLVKAAPDYIIDDMSELLDIVKQADII